MNTATSGKILDNQLKLQELISKRNVEFDDFQHLLNMYTAAILGELDEVNCEANYKWWKNTKDIDYKHLEEEIADVFIISLDFLVRGYDRDAVLNILHSVIVDSDYYDENNIIKSEDIIKYKNSVYLGTRQIARELLSISERCDNASTATLKECEKSIQAEYALYKYRSIFTIWSNLVATSGFIKSIEETILTKQAENIQRQLGNVKGREEYKLN